jgi:hypothetical protein
MTDRELSERISLRISPLALQKIEAIASMRSAAVSQCIRDMLDHFLSDGADGRNSELARIKNVMGRRHRGRRT